MLKRIFQIALVSIMGFSVLSLTVGCDDSNKQQESNEYQDIIKDIDEIEFQISQEMILKSSSQRDKESIRKLLRDIRSGFIRLSQNPQDQLGYTLIERAIKQLRYDHIQILEKDRAVLSPLVQQASELAYASAKQYSKLFQVDWVIYSFRFSEDLDKQGFVSWPRGGWQVDWALDRSYVSTRGQDSDAWLIAPSMDLTEVENAKFRIVHTLNINSNDRESYFNRQDFLKQSFRARVSLDYKGGDPDPDKCDCHWQDVSLGTLPSSKDFHTVESPEIDLSQFRGENVTIALYYDTRGLPKHYVNWNISLFEVSGAGTYEQSQGRVVKTLISYSFAKKKLEPFRVLSQLPDSFQWETGGRRPGSYEWAVIKNKEHNKAPFKRTSSLLLSPRITLKGAKKPVFSLVEVINHIGGVDLSELKILISSDYNGGDVLDATWIPVERSFTEVPEKSWGDMTTTGVSLSDMPNNTFTLMFWYDSQKDSNVIWELKSFSVEAKGGELLTNDFETPPYINPLSEAGGPVDR